MTYIKLQKNNPVNYFTLLIFSIGIYLNFFFKNQFFTGSGTTDLTLLFSNVPTLCIIAIPVICYKSSFSVYDDFIPLAKWKKLLCRFRSVCCVYAVMLLTLVPAVVCIGLFGSIDAGQFIASMICLAAYGTAVIAFCIFIYELVPNQIAALIICTVSLTILNISHLGALYFQLNDFISVILQHISFAWHFDAASKGIIDTRDISWLILTCIIFLYSALYTTEKKAGKQYSKNLKLRVILHYTVLVLLTLNLSKYYARIDISKNKSYTMSKYSKELIKSNSETINITYYRSSALSKLYPQIRDIIDFLSAYSRQSKNIHLQLIDPDKKPETQQLLEDNGIIPQQLRTVNNTTTQLISVYSAIIIECNGKIQTIPNITNAASLEFDLSSRISNLLSGKQRIVNIIVGNGYSLLDDYDYLLTWLSAQGFYCNPLLIEKPQFSDFLNATSGPLLVIGDSEISIDQAIAIENYILQGKGNAFFTLSQFSTTINDEWNITLNKKTNLVEMIENWGVQFLDEIAGDISCSRITFVSEDNTNTQVINNPLWINAMPQTNAPAGITCFWASPLKLQENAAPLIISSPAAYSYKMDKNSPSKLFETNPFELQKRSTADLPKETKILGAQIKGQLQGLYNYGSSINSTIEVISDQYFLSSLMLGYNNGDFRNLDFISNRLLRLNNEEKLAELHSKQTRDTSLYKITDTIMMIKRELLTLAILFIGVPAVIITAFLISFIKRRRYGKQK